MYILLKLQAASGCISISHCISLCLQHPQGAEQRPAQQQPAEQKPTQQQQQQQHLQPGFEGIKGTEAASRASGQLPTEFGEVKLLRAPAPPAPAQPATAQPAQSLRSEFGEVKVLGEPEFSA